MKKIAFFTILSIFAITNQLQAQEPTKQETIDWIVSKFKAYGSNATYVSSGKFLDADKLWSDVFQYTKVEVVGGSIIKYTCEDVKSTTYRYHESVMLLDFSEINQAEIYEQEGFKSIALKGPNIFKKFDYEQTFINDKSGLSLKNQIISSQTKINVPKYPSYKPEGWYSINYIDFSSEPELFNRLLKAFQTLAKYNNANKPKEKF